MSQTFISHCLLVFLGLFNDLYTCPDTFFKIPSLLKKDFDKSSMNRFLDDVNDNFTHDANAPPAPEDDMYVDCDEGDVYDDALRPEIADKTFGVAPHGLGDNTGQSGYHSQYCFICCPENVSEFFITLSSALDFFKLFKVFSHHFA